jgi:hypothetical protein
MMSAGDSLIVGDAGIATREQFAQAMAKKSFGRIAS